MSKKSRTKKKTISRAIGAAIYHQWEPKIGNFSDGVFFTMWVSDNKRKVKISITLKS